MGVLLVSLFFLAVATGLPFPQQLTAKDNSNAFSTSGFKVDKIVPEGNTVTKVVIQVPNNDAPRNFQTSQFTQHYYPENELIEKENVQQQRAHYAPQGVPENMPHLFLPAQPMTQAVEHIPQGIHISAPRNQQAPRIDVSAQPETNANSVPQVIQQSITNIQEEAERIPQVSNKYLIAQQIPQIPQTPKQTHPVQTVKQDSQPTKPVDPAIQPVALTPQEQTIQQSSQASPKVTPEQQNAFQSSHIVQQEALDRQPVLTKPLVMVHHGPDGVHIIRQEDYNQQHQQSENEHTSSSPIQSPQPTPERQTIPGEQGRQPSVQQDSHGNQIRRQDEQQIQSVPFAQPGSERIQMVRQEEQQAQSTPLVPQEPHGAQNVRQEVQQEQSMVPFDQPESHVAQIVRQEEQQAQSVPFVQPGSQGVPIVSQKEQPVQSVPFVQPGSQGVQIVSQKEQQVQSVPFVQPGFHVVQQTVRQEVPLTQSIPFGQRGTQEAQIVRQEEQQIQSAPLVQSGFHGVPIVPVHQEEQQIQPVPFVQQGSHGVQFVRPDEQQVQSPQIVSAVHQEGEQAVFVVQHGPNGVQFIRQGEYNGQQQSQKNVQQSIQHHIQSNGHQNAQQYIPVQPIVHQDLQPHVLVQQNVETTFQQQQQNSVQTTEDQKQHKEADVHKDPQQHIQPNLEQKVKHEVVQNNERQETPAQSSIQSNRGITQAMLHTDGVEKFAPEVEYKLQLVSQSQQVSSPIRQVTQGSYLSFGNNDKTEVNIQDSGIAQHLPPLLQKFAQNVVAEVPQVSQTIKDATQGVQVVPAAVHQVSQGVHHFTQGVQQAFQSIAGSEGSHHKYREKQDAHLDQENRQIPFQQEDLKQFQSLFQRQPPWPQYGNRKPAQSTPTPPPQSPINHNQIYDNQSNRVGSPAETSSDEVTPPTSIPIIRYENSLSPDGTYQWSYEAGNGIKAQESGLLRNRGDPEKEAIAVQGGYSYTGPDGIFYSVEYIADENGFQPLGRHLPTQPPIPEALQKAIDQHMAILATAQPEIEEQKDDTSVTFEH